MLCRTLRRVGSVLATLAVGGACSQEPPEHKPAPPVATDSVPLDTLLARLGAPSVEVRRAAAIALSRPGARIEDRVRALGATLGDTSKRVGSAAAWSLGQLGDASVPTLLHALTDRHATVRVLAVYALGAVGPSTAPADHAVHAALADPDQSVREMATWAVKQISPRGEGVPQLGSAEDLAAGLAAQDPAARLSAARRYQPYAGDPSKSIPLLIRALGDPDPRVRQAASDALVMLGTTARDALVAALADSNPAVRREASVALVRLGRAAP